MSGIPPRRDFFLTPENFGKRGQYIATQVWPGLTLASNRDDKDGTDAWWQGRPVQIKTEWRTSHTGNVVYEVYKRNGPWASYDMHDGEWRETPTPRASDGSHDRAAFFIWVTHGYAIGIDRLVIDRLTFGRRLQSINSTCRGYLVPVTRLRDHGADLRPHTFSLRTF